MSNSYKGTALNDMHGGLGPWNYETPPILPSKFHSVLYEIPINLVTPPVPFKVKEKHHWEDGYVRMPYSEKNLFPSHHNNNELVSRWELIKEALIRKISSSQELEEAINSYNSKNFRFTSLHHLFEIYTSEESNEFFHNDLPEISNLALQLPDLVPGNIQLLKALSCYSISLSQMQIACLLANAFFCTFPWRKDMSTSYPGINFITLFTAFNKDRPNQSVIEKIRCILHYFKRVLRKNPIGVLTFERQHLRRNKCPRWDKCENNLGNTKLHVSSLGTIEDDGLGLMQVDFANKFVGGGVLGYGCVQEEIRYVICPELIVVRLFTEKLDSTEALIIIGSERYSMYQGYSNTFEWAGDYVDDTPYDDDGRRRTSIVAIDATQFTKTTNQFHASQILRELNKAYSGFYSRLAGRIPPVGTGNWGCGAFRGDLHLKFLIQIMASSAANRDLVYFTFGDEELRDNIYEMYIFIANNQITISQLWRILCHFIMANLPADKLFPFIQQSYFDSKKQPKITNFFTQSQPSTSSENTQKLITNSKSPEPKVSPKRLTNDYVIPIETNDIEKPLHFVKKKCVKRKPMLLDDDDDSSVDILSLIAKIEGDKKVAIPSSLEDAGQGFFDLLEKRKEERIRKETDEIMNVDEESVSQEISDKTVVLEKIVEKVVSERIDKMVVSENRRVLNGKKVDKGSEKRKITDYFNLKMFNYIYPYVNQSKPFKVSNKVKIECRGPTRRMPGGRSATGSSLCQ